MSKTVKQNDSGFKFTVSVAAESTDIEKPVNINVSLTVNGNGISKEVVAVLKKQLAEALAKS